MKKIAHLIFIFLVNLMWQSANAVNQEKLIFSCQLKNQATITIHRSHHIEPNYTYRFTRNGKVELKLTQTQTQMRLNSRVNQLQFRGNGVSMFFPNGNYGYNVFSAFEIPEKDDDDIILRSGVIVSNGDDYNKHIYCHRTFKRLSDEYL